MLEINEKLIEGKKILSLNETLQSKYKIKVPEGPLFYPSSGSDTIEPIKLFIDTVSEYHFVDIAFVPSLPMLEANPNRPYVSRGCFQKLDKEYIIPLDIIKSADRKRNMRREVDNKILEKLKELNIESVGYRGRDTITRKEIWEYTPEIDRTLEIYAHRQDGLIKFMELDKIAVFFLRGDSMGEGGSGQEWFKPNIFDLIIDKLLDGGFIVTDGSGYYGNYEEYSGPSYPNTFPWENKCVQNSDTWDEKLKKPKDFNYRNREFICVGECGERYGTVYLWKVQKIKRK